MSNRDPVSNNDVECIKTNLIQEASLTESDGIRQLTLSLYFDKFDTTIQTTGMPRDAFATVEDRLLWMLDHGNKKFIPRLGAALKRRDAGSGGAIPNYTATTVSAGDDTHVINLTSNQNRPDMPLTRQWVGHQMGVAEVKGGDDNDPSSSLTNYNTYTIVGRIGVSGHLVLDKYIRPENILTQNVPNGTSLRLLPPMLLDPTLYFCVGRMAIPYGNGVKVILKYQNWGGTKEKVGFERFTSDSRFSYYPGFTGPPAGAPRNAFGKPNQVVAWMGNRVVRQVGNSSVMDFFCDVRGVSFIAPTMNAALRIVRKIGVGSVNARTFLDEIPARWQMMPPDLISIGQTQRVFCQLLFRLSPVRDQDTLAAQMNRGEPWWPIIPYIASDGRSVAGELAPPRWAWDHAANQKLVPDFLSSGEVANPQANVAVPGWISNGYARLKNYPDNDFTTPIIESMNYTDPADEVYVDSSELLTMVSEAATAPPPEPDPDP